MTTLMTLTVALAALNGALALVLAGVYLRNLRQVRSPFTWGLALFALFLVAHSALTVYDDVTMMADFTSQAERLLLAEGVLELAALGALAWATLR
jgi:hypothetical protein